MSYYDLRHFFDGGEGASAAFDARLDETAKAPPAEREGAARRLGQGARSARMPPERGAPFAAHAAPGSRATARGLSTTSAT